MRRPALALLVAGMALTGQAAAATLSCSLQAPPRQALGHSLLVQFTLTNTGPEPLWVLRWNTPWEGRWMAPFATLSRDGQALDYQGAMVKRAAPDASAYLHLAPGQVLRASMPLAPAFDLRRAGRYQLQPAITLGDVQVQQGRDGPRLGQPWTGVELDCGEARFELLVPR
jgi:peptidyl-Lys metalloendopeptidase